MSDTNDPLNPRPGRHTTRRRISAEGLAFVLSLIWLGFLFVAYRVLGLQGQQIADTLGLIVVALAVFLPVALIWLSVLVLRAARDMRNEAVQLQASIQTMRQSWDRDQHATKLAAPEPAQAPQPITPVPPDPDTKAQPALFSSSRADASGHVSGGISAPGSEGAQPVLALENPLPPAYCVDTADFIRALHFPETDTDEMGFAALRRALQDHGTGDLIRAAQDVLTALSQEGIYMDDLRPDRARPEIWRAFANGARGHQIAGLGGIRDRSCLALTAARMRSDPNFRDAAHRFLRAFDREFALFEARANDGEIARFSETRSARSFMVLGRVAGIFG